MQINIDIEVGQVFTRFHPPAIYYPAMKMKLKIKVGAEFIQFRTTSFRVRTSSVTFFWRKVEHNEDRTQRESNTTRIEHDENRSRRESNTTRIEPERICTQCDGYQSTTTNLTINHPLVLIVQAVRASVKLDIIVVVYLSIGFELVMPPILVP